LQKGLIYEGGEEKKSKNQKMKDKRVAKEGYQMSHEQRKPIDP